MMVTVHILLLPSGFEQSSDPGHVNFLEIAVMAFSDRVCLTSLLPCSVPFFSVCGCVCFCACMPASTCCEASYSYLGRRSCKEVMLVLILLPAKPFHVIRRDL